MWGSRAAPSCSLGLRSPLPAASDEHRGPDRDALVEVENLLIQQADAAARDLLANGPGLVGAMNAEQGVAAVLVEVERAGPERIVEPALLEARQVGLEAHNRGGRTPVRPDRLAANIGSSSPGVALLAHANAVANSGTVVLNEVEEALVNIDHDRARPLATQVGYELRKLVWAYAVSIDQRDGIGLIGKRAHVPGRLALACDGRPRHDRVASGQRSACQGTEESAS